MGSRVEISHVQFAVMSMRSKTLDNMKSRGNMVEKVSRRLMRDDLTAVE